MKILSKNDTILFQGDSITDSGRVYSNNNLGFGYVGILTAILQANYLEENYRILNRGISGNRVIDLKARWEEDCINLKPDVLSILIGINDTWRKYDQNDETTAEDYEKIYRDILLQAKKSNENIKFVILEPFVMHYPEDRKTWREDLDPKRAAAKKLADEFNAVFIPLDSIFEEACKIKDSKFFSEDGVHPTLEGNGLIAKAWLDYCVL